jgi:hypothetical protein
MHPCCPRVPRSGWSATFPSGRDRTKPDQTGPSPKFGPVTKSLYANELCYDRTNRTKECGNFPNSAQYAQFLQPLVRLVRSES